MPIYEYACTCGSQFEELVIRRADEESLVCRTCGGKDLKRQMSRTSAARPGNERGTAGRGCGPVG
jgi:putative FmdB family regulatory protein